MTEIKTVAIVGCGIGRSHVIEGYLPNADRFKVIAVCDIASHQCEQFLFFANTLDAEVISATVANRAHPDKPGLQDVGDIHLKAPNATGYIRVDWFTPAGLPTWGDGRLTILGTEGYIELRKYVDIAGRPGADHLFLVDGEGMRHSAIAQKSI